MKSRLDENFGTSDPPGDPEVPRIVIIQVRSQSGRLPSKCFRTLAGETLISHVLLRALAISDCDLVCVATTNHSSDDLLVDFLSSIQDTRLTIFRGDPSDVQSRFLEISSGLEECLISRITADDPFRSPKLSSEGFDFLTKNPIIDYFSYADNSLPLGLNGEVFRVSALRRAREVDDSDYSREHVTPVLRTSPLFRQEIRDAGFGLHSKARLTIDLEEDLVLNRRVAIEIQANELDYSWDSTMRAMLMAKRAQGED